MAREGLLGARVKKLYAVSEDIAGDIVDKLDSMKEVEADFEDKVGFFVMQHPGCSMRAIKAEFATKSPSKVTVVVKQLVQDGLIDHDGQGFRISRNSRRCFIEVWI